MRLLLVLPLLLLAAGAPAETPPPAAVPAPNLAPQQAEQALEVLQDPAKRARTIAVLEVLTKVGAAAPPALAPSTPSPATQAPAASLAQNSLGAGVLLDASEWLSTSSSETLATAGSVTKLPALWRFVTSTTTDPWSQWLPIDAAWRFAVVAVVAIGSQLLTQRLLRRAMHARARRTRKHCAGGSRRQYPARSVWLGCRNSMTRSWATTINQCSYETA